jgi:phage FluMu protein Com
MSIIVNRKVGESSNIFACEKCSFNTVKKSNYDEHILTAKHLKSINVNENVAKKSSVFACEKCNFNTVKKSNYDKHILTAKHLKSINVTENVAKSSKKSTTHICTICNKIYKEASGLWKHKKKCPNTENTNKTDIQTTTDSSNNDFVFDKELVMMIFKQNQEVIKQNSELQTMVMEVVKNGTQNNINSNNNTNSHNKTFNLQFFLNETCKDAMNIMDFVDSIKLQLSDLEKVGNIGYVEGISNIITTNLKALDVTQRPIHCSDVKREVLYVKDENKWEKENEEKKKIRKAIKYVAHKNTKLISQFKDKYPDCVKSYSKKSDQYNKLIIEAMGGKGDNDLEKEDKIIKKISKQVIIDK